MTQKNDLQYCIFCEIIAGREPADVWYQDDEFIVFRNQLRWLPVQLLLVPKKHMTQSELWSDIGRAAELADSLGKEFAPNGYRLLSNFGQDGMQSQPHAHIHVLGGTQLGMYVGANSW